MPAMQSKLEETIRFFDIAETADRPLQLQGDLLQAGDTRLEINRVYKELGGCDEHFTFNGRWDIFTSGYILELDEQLHFNRYRRLTLESDLYKELPRFPIEEYKAYCNRYEDKCLHAGSHGGKWKNHSSDRMFGVANINGHLEGNGSSRWKQRAFYDYVKDLSFLLTGIPVVRLSIYDEVDTSHGRVMIKDILSQEIISDSEAMGIRRLIDQRLR